MKFIGGNPLYSSCNTNGGSVNENTGMCNANANSSFSGSVNNSQLYSNNSMPYNQELNFASCLSKSNFGGGAIISFKNKRIINLIFNKMKKNKKNNLNKLVNKEKNISK